MHLISFIFYVLFLFVVLFLNKIIKFSFNFLFRLFFLVFLFILQFFVEFLYLVPKFLWLKALNLETKIWFQSIFHSFFFFFSLQVFQDCDEGGKGYLTREDLKVSLVLVFGYKPSKVTNDNYQLNYAISIRKKVFKNLCYLCW